jgi:quercetin dioxygenase-like cupin family protein
MMLRRSTRFDGSLAIVAAVTITTLGSAAVGQEGEPERRGPKTLFSMPLTDVPGKNLVVVELDFAPNPAPPSTHENHRRGHRHPGSVYVHVIEGAVRLGVEGEPVQVVPTGGSFFEAPGVLHIIAENASATAPARAVAVMIVPDGAPLTTPDDGK